jgi:hypothetical protein
MPWKLGEDGNVVTENGMPVFVNNGKESPFDGDGTIATISRLNGEAKSHRERAEEFERKYKPFEGIDDPVAARKALDTVKNLDDKKLVDAGEVERVKQEVLKAAEAQWSPFKAKSEQLQQQLDSHLIGGAFSKSAFIAKNFAAEGPAGVEIAQALFGSRLKVEDGRVVGYDSQGNKLYSPTRHGELADADEAIEIMVNQYAHKDHILKGSGASGGGAGGGKPSGGGGAKSMSRTQYEQLSPTEQRSFAIGGGKLTD